MNVTSVILMKPNTAGVVVDCSSIFKKSLDLLGKLMSGVMVSAECFSGVCSVLLRAGGGSSRCTCPADPESNVRPKFNPTLRGFLGFSRCLPLSLTLSRNPSPPHHLKLPTGSIVISPRDVNPSSPATSTRNSRLLVF